MRVLFITPVPREAAAYRARIEQYLPYLERQGISADIRPFISSKFFAIVYKERRFLKKARYFIESTINRFYGLIKAKDYDLIFVFRETFPFGPPFFEWFFSKLGKPIIYDFDDAIYLPNISTANRILGFLKYPQKVSHIIAFSKHIVVCNDFLKEYAQRFNNAVTVIPTSVDTEIFKPKFSKPNNSEPVIGWIGSHSTTPYLDQLVEVFQILAKRYKFVVKIIGADGGFKIPGVEVINEEWSLGREVENFQSLDIGVYPLPNTEWVKGKTGFKTVQYMSVGIPCVASKAGRNLEIIEDGVNGLLANSKEEWVDKISFLIENPALRRKLGMGGRSTVETKYSLSVNAPKLIKVLEEVYSESKK